MKFFFDSTRNRFYFLPTIVLFHGTCGHPLCDNTHTSIEVKFLLWEFGVHTK